MTAEPPESRGTKAGRNEQRKIAATFLNNLAVGCFLAALLQPVLALLQQSRAVTLAEWSGSAILFVGSLGLHFGARAVAGRLED